MLHDGRGHRGAATLPSMRKQETWRLRRDDGCSGAPLELLQALLHRRRLGVRALRLCLLRDAWQRMHPTALGRVPVP